MLYAILVYTCKQNFSSIGFKPMPHFRTYLAERYQTTAFCAQTVLPYPTRHPDKSRKSGFLLLIGPNSELNTEEVE